MSAIDHEPTPRSPKRAEGVGSVLRPPALKKVFDQAYGGALHVDLLSPERQAAVETLGHLADDVTPEIVRHQIDAGLDVVTDGELRRGFFVNSVIDAVAGIDFKAKPTAEGHVASVTKRLTKKDNPALREAQALMKITDFPMKVTFPAPSFFYWRDVVDSDGSVYADRQEFVDDIVRIERELVQEVIAAGVNHIQFDFPMYPMLVDGKAPERTAEIGETPDTLLEKALAADAQVVADIPAHVTKALHLCRGNEIRFFHGSIEPVAERVFALPYDRFLVEFHDEEDGSYDTIRHVPASKIMVMGLISTKTPEVEDEDDLVRRLERASAFLDVSQLAISPQCGFSSTWRGHAYSEDIQWRKLEVAGRVAARVWGSR